MSSLSLLYERQHAIRLSLRVSRFVPRVVTAHSHCGRSHYYNGAELHNYNPFTARKM